MLGSRIILMWLWLRKGKIILQRFLFFGFKIQNKSKKFCGFGPSKKTDSSPAISDAAPQQ
jgi:hypothetical protein